MFYRTVSMKRTHNGTRYEHIQWWHGTLDVVVDGIWLKNLTADEYDFFYFTF